MLRFLAVRDFVIVESLELDFAPGFSVLTGETGAGKSILVDALALVLGERGDAGVVRQGARQAEISAQFDAPPALADWLLAHDMAAEEGVCILRRVIDAAGRSRAYVNGRSATLGQLREAGEFLVDIHGQHAHQSLARADAQRELLDAHAGLGVAAAAVRDAHARWRRLRDALAAAEGDARRIAEEREQVAWRLEELERLDPREGEWEEVQREHTRLANAAALLEGVEAAVQALSESDGAVLSVLGTVAARLEALADFDPALRPVGDLVEPARIQVQEAARELGQYLRRADLDPERLAAVAARVEALHGAGRRLRVPPGDLPNLRVQVRERLDELRLAADTVAMGQAVEAARAEYLELAGRLSAARAKAAARLGRAVTAAMQDLALSGGRFEIRLERLEEGAAYGLERVEFLVAGHAGVDPRPLAKVASGGELSRIGLAIQVITSTSAPVPTLVFDEVDSGIGGAVADLVGRQLRTLGGARQVLCVTHLPQVAARAEGHWRVSKQSSGGSTVSSVVALDRPGRIEEIARMLGGAGITATTRKAAREMLDA
ncbi:MAG: DNA repair protein RecN [Burkholderiales bacterium]|nr:DNA repair protein RecN [Burkholderiales bacterium]